MKKIIGFVKRQPHYFWLYGAVTLITHLLTYWLPDLFKTDQYHLLGSAVDEAVPFIPGFIYIYVGSFIFWPLSYAYFYSWNQALAIRLLTADLLCKAVAFFAFCLYPCTLSQPVPEEITGFGAWLVKFIYASDKPTKLLPSMHCYVSILLALPPFCRQAAGTPKWMKMTFPLIALSICASTLFVKQHVFDDIWTAAILAVGAWLISLLVWRKNDLKRQATL